MPDQQAARLVRATQRGRGSTHARMRDMMRHLATLVLVIALLRGCDGARKPSLNSKNDGARSGANEEGLGSQLLSAVLHNDIAAAKSIFASSSSSQARAKHASSWAEHARGIAFQWLTRACLPHALGLGWRRCGRGWRRG